MNRRIERALADAIDEIRSGSRSVDEVLARPEARDPEFEPLLRLALSIAPVENLEIAPHVKQALRARVMNEIAHENAKRPFPLNLGIRNPFPALRRAATPALAIILGLALVASGTVYASQDSLPGDALYGVKIAVEQAQVALALSPEAKINALMRSSRRRTEEMALERGGRPGDVGALARQYEAGVEQALQILDTMSDGNKEQIASRLLDNLERHQAQLQEVYDNAPEQAKEAVLRAKEKSAHGLETAAAMVGKEKAHGAKGSSKEMDPTATPDASTMPAISTPTLSTTPSPTTSPHVPGSAKPDRDEMRKDKEKDIHDKDNEEAKRPSTRTRPKPTATVPRPETHYDEP